MFRKSLSLTFLFVVAFAGACATEGPDTEGAERGPIGKADLYGSCQDSLDVTFTYCGGRSEGNCYCDDLCSFFGDCCEDYEATCVSEPDPEPEPQPQHCGGFAGLTCPDDQYCAYAPEDNCGFADATGICQPRPEICPPVYDPVCGCNGVTYSNACSAASAGASVAHEGECVVTCGDTVCDPGEECQWCWGTFQCVPGGAMC